MDVLSRVMRWFPGWVRVETEGGYPERLLNDLTAVGVPVWHVRRREEWTRFSCLAGDYRSLRPLARRACVRMRLRQKHGFPFWRHRYRHRKGLLVGLALYGVILALLAPRIWVVQVVGNTDTPTEEILAVARQRGVVIGARMDQLDIKGLQINGPDDLPTLSWITVNPNSCVARVEVTERIPTPEVIDLSVPSDIVALRDGRILRMEVRSGRRLVRDGEAVTAGTVLITGRVETDLGEKLYRSYGEVWAETQRRITVSVPLLYTRPVPEGTVIYRPTVTFLCWDFPLYSNSALQGDWIHRQTRYFLTARDMTLPLGVTNDYYLPVVAQKTARTAEQARLLAEQQLAAQEAALFAPNTYEQLTREGEIREGVYVLTATYRCRENIAAEVPIGQTLPIS